MGLAGGVLAQRVVVKHRSVRAHDGNERATSAFAARASFFCGKATMGRAGPAKPRMNEETRIATLSRRIEISGRHSSRAFYKESCAAQHRCNHCRGTGIAFARRSTSEKPFGQIAASYMWNSPPPGIRSSSQPSISMHAK